MINKKAVAFAAVCASLLALAPALRADGDVEFLEPHPMPVYPGSVEISEGEKLNRLTKDELAAVRKYFESRLKPGDRIEDFSGDGEKGFMVVYAKKFGKKELKVQELRVSARTASRPPHTAFAELNAQVSYGRRSGSEFEALRKEYADIDSAYFRRVGGRDESEAIADLAAREAHPDGEKLKAAGRGNKVSDADKAEARDLKRRMKELKAKGDFAGMMELAQSSKKFQAPPENMAAAAKMAADDRNRDTWDIWTRCLRDTKAAAYRVRLDYTAGTIN